MIQKFKRNNRLIFKIIIKFIYMIYKIKTEKRIIKKLKVQIIRFQSLSRTDFSLINITIINLIDKLNFIASWCDSISQIIHTFDKNIIAHFSTYIFTSFNFTLLKKCIVSHPKNIQSDLLLLIYILCNCLKLLHCW